MNDTAAAMSNEEFIAEFRDWRLQWKKGDQDEVPYISKLAELIAPHHLCSVSKAVRKDFFLEQLMLAQSRESRRKVTLAEIALDGFLAQLRVVRKQKKPKGGRS